jgi:hypothetical protein
MASPREFNGFCRHCQCETSLYWCGKILRCRPQGHYIREKHPRIKATVPTAKVEKKTDGITLTVPASKPVQLKLF